VNDDDFQSGQTSAKRLNWILATAIALVAGAIAWVGWTVIDSVQKNERKLQNFHVTADNSKIDSHHLDVVKQDLDTQVFTDKLTESQEIQGALVKQEGSEVFFSSGTAAIDRKKYAEGVVDFTKALDLIPSEAQRKSEWFAFGCKCYRNTYTMWTLRQRAHCYIELDRCGAAVADLDAAIKARSDSPACYRFRAMAYYKLGKKALGDADIKRAAQLTIKHPGQPLP
jgi:tetratricopeptide (TPR) repeat protein